MHELTRFTMSDMTECGRALRRLASSAESMEAVAGKIVHYLYDHLIDPDTGKNAMTQVRFFKTHDYDDLSPDLRAFADGILDGSPAPPDMKCLCLLATIGENPEWNSRDNSTEHKAIPLPSEELVRQFPMISNLVKQFGLELTTILKPDPSCLRDLNETTYNVFLVPEARGSAFIPHQEDFVDPYGVRSVLGFGGVLPSGNLFATIMFSKVAITQEIADLFRPLTLSVKIALLEHDETRVFS